MNYKSRPHLRINGERLISSIRAMGSVGFDPETGGRTRLALTDEDKAGRDLLCRWMRDEGLEVKIDEIGNIFGIREGSDPSELPVMMGSHIDTVRDAGMFDGVYGVLGGLEVIRTLNENEVTPKSSLVVAAFTNEEGARFQPDMMGSLYYTRKVELGELLSSRDDSGITVGEELDRIGYGGAYSTPVGCYLELHVEQGPRLHAEGVSIGIVEGVQGLAWWTGEYYGESNHAGSTPMEMRKDTLLAVAELALEAEKLALSLGRGSVATMGRIAPRPDIINIVPGKCSFTLDFRQFDGELFEEGKREVEKLIVSCAARRGLKYCFKKAAEAAPVIFDRGMVELVGSRAAFLGLDSMKMISGASHDAQFLSSFCPTVMIFVPSVGGRSHCPEEWTDVKDLENGCNVLLHSVLELV
ncbi:MAG: Zn-dependent hydrolase [Synergistaceae bacterium]|jgi:N-carbamoyl-L-amino-acid hydrolase|nr:Zn-dependent hydrolase [Synergistaceae bacterium]MDD2350029.1 Zn-dependent hydrolase [Synergistaceae bacterium]MDD3318564.1 Zn-dependent hydrolase [Synergistaceae bacterium]MDD3672371.1 Zn-dependent hydrolase [Synergistaceae bacterium]MDD3963199.1 Zn-dependent hydrolase [Synergistaceae bacterium]